MLRDRRRRPGAGEQSQDFRDQRGVCGPVPGRGARASRGRAKQERQEHAVGLARWRPRDLVRCARSPTAEGLDHQAWEPRARSASVRGRAWPDRARRRPGRRARVGERSADQGSDSEPVSVDLQRCLIAQVAGFAVGRRSETLEGACSIATGSTSAMRPNRVRVSTATTTAANR